MKKILSLLIMAFSCLTYAQVVTPEVEVKETINNATIIKSGGVDRLVIDQNGVNVNGLLQSTTFGIGTSSPGQYNLLGRLTNFGSLLDVRGKITTDNGVHVVGSNPYGTNMDQVIFSYSVNQTNRNNGQTSGFVQRVTSNGPDGSFVLGFYGAHSSAYGAPENAGIQVVDGFPTLSISRKGEPNNPYKPNEYRVGVKTANPQYDLHVNGLLWASNFTEGSDLRWKQDIQDIDNASTTLSQLRPVSYRWNKDDYPDQNFDETKHYGVIAQEIGAGEYG